MKTLLIFVLLLGWGGLAQPADAAAVSNRQAYCDARWRALPPTDPARPPGYRRFMDRCLADCPDPREREDRTVYRGDLRNYCEVRWTAVLAAHQTGGLTHDQFVDGCLRRCAPAGFSLGWLLGGLAGEGALIGVIASQGDGGGSHTPASP